MVIISRILSDDVSVLYLFKILFAEKKQLRLLVLGECQLQLPYLAKLCKERNLKFAKGGVKKKDYQEALWNYLQSEYLSFQLRESSLVVKAILTIGI